MTAASLRVLVLDGRAAELARTRQALAVDPQLLVETAATLAEAEQRIACGGVDVLLCEPQLADGSVHHLVLALRGRLAALAIVVFSDSGSAQEVLALMRLGADDWLRKSATEGPALATALRDAHRRRLRGRRRHDRRLNVLYVESDPMDADVTLRHLAVQAPHLRLVHVRTAAEAAALLPSHHGLPCPFDVVLTDYRLPGDTGLDLLALLREERHLNVPVVLITGQGSHTVAAEALRLGATDYLAKDAQHLALLPLVLENAFHRAASEREHARLQASQERLDLIVQGSNDGAWDVDLLRGQAYTSPRFWTMLGLEPRSVLDAPALYDVIAPQERQPLQDRVEALLADSGVQRFELECHLVHADGHLVPIVTRGVVRRDALGQPVRMAGTHTDLTAWRRIEREIRELAASLEQRVQARTEELAQANKELEAYAESISADVRAPLHAVDALAQLLGREHGSGLGADGLRLLGLLRSSVYRAESLIRDLLAFARSAREPLVIGQVPMAAVARHCLSEQAQAIDDQALRVVLEPLPDAQGDVTLLRQVMAQLIANAIKFSAERPGTQITIGHDGGAWFVRDEGVGFDPVHAQERLFKLFSRLHGGRYGGNGVGLAIAARLVERHGGRIWADSHAGRGSTFFFTLGEPGVQS